jgi:hypothetical protein
MEQHTKGEKQIKQAEQREENAVGRAREKGMSPSPPFLLMQVCSPSATKPSCVNEGGFDLLEKGFGSSGLGLQWVVR